VSRQLMACAALFSLAAAGAAQAHHSFSMFDRNQTATVTGTVKSFELINPHGWLNVMVADPQGRVNEWSMEMGGPGQAQRQGLSKDSIHPGDKITVRLHPLRDGSYGGQLVSVTLANGQTLGQADRPG
jgi:hypothetical protein